VVIFLVPVVLGVGFSRQIQGSASEILKTVNVWFVNGQVIVGIVLDDEIPGVTRIEPFEESREDDRLYILTRWARLTILRGYQFLNIMPPLWSERHQIYYALHIVPFYVLSLIALVRAFQTGETYFLWLFGVFLASFALHSLARVDAALRTGFTHFPFLIICAGYGFDYVWKLTAENREKLRKRLCWLTDHQL